MIICTAILFEHHRIESMMQNEEYVIGSDELLGDLPVLGIHQIIIDKQAVKTYTPYGNQKSYYLPTGMQGPMVKLLCSVENIYPWQSVYSNDYLVVKEFGFPTYNRTLPTHTNDPENSSWWVDNISYEAKQGFIYHGALRYELNLDLYKRSVVG